MIRRNPYKLFDYYREEDAALFFGREREVSAVVGDILANKLLVLFARSGSGKTSLLRAGIGPALREVGRIDDDDPGIQMVTIRLSGTETPEQSALVALKRALGERGPAAGETLHQALRRVFAFSDPGKPEAEPPGIVLVFDQFEELFITLFKDRPEQRQEFARQLAAIIHDDSLRAYVVLSLRSEYFHHLNEFRGVIPSIFQNNTNLELRPFDDDAALRVIRGPAEHPESGFSSWEPGLPERIVADLKPLNDEKDGVLPIQLQVVCHGLWECLGPDDRVITAKHYESRSESGNDASSPASAMIQQRLIGPLDAVKGRKCQRGLYRLLRELMTRHQTKVPRSLTDLLCRIQDPLLSELLGHLTEKRLVRREKAEEETWFELSHDYLAYAITPWLEKREREMKSGDQIRRGFAVAGLLAVSIAATMLRVDWTTYTAHLGLAERPNELVIQRKKAFGTFEPAWWHREITTGFSRRLLHASGVKNHNFAVSHALSDWKEVELQLNDKPSWDLQFAARIARKGDASAAIDAGFFQALQHPDIQFYAAVDRRIFQMLLEAATSGNSEAKTAAINALGALGPRIPAEQLPASVQALMGALKDPDPNVRSSAASAVGNLGESFPPEELPTLVTILSDSLKDKNYEVRDSAIDSLSALGASLSPDQLTAIVEGFLKIDGEDFDLASAFASLDDNLSATQLPGFVEALLGALDHKSPGVRGSVADVLGYLAEKLLAEQLVAVGDALLRVFTDPDSDVRSSAARALGNLGGSLPEQQLSATVAGLREALQDESPDVCSSAADALASLSNAIPPAELPAVVDALLKALEVQESATRSSATDALVYFGASLSAEQTLLVVRSLLGRHAIEPNGVGVRVASSLVEFRRTLSSDQIPVFLDILLGALRDRRTGARDIAVDALGDLGEGLSADQQSSVLDALFDALDTPDSDFRGTVAGALGNLAASVPAKQRSVIVDALVPLLNDPALDNRSSIAVSLVDLGEKLPAEQLPAVVDALLTALDDPDSDDRGPIARALGGLGEYLTDVQKLTVAEALLREVKKRDSDIRTSAADALGDLAGILPSEPMTEVIDALIDALADPDSEVQESAAVNLGEAGTVVPDERLPKIVEALLGAFNSEVFSGRVSAARGLLRIELRNRTAKHAPSYFLEAELSEGYSEGAIVREVRRLASSAWRETDAQLLQALENDDSRWRVFALQVLAHRQPPEAQTLVRLHTLRDDPRGRPWVKLAALRCLVEMEREEYLREEEAKEAALNEDASSKDETPEEPTPTTE